MAPPTTFDQTRARFAVRLLNGCGAWLDRGGISRGFVSTEEIVNIAKRRSCFDDFGGDDFLEPLARLLDSCEREARLNVIGKAALRSDVLRNLCNRLALQRDRQLLPEIAQQEIRPPIFIVGLPRSGTTLLHTLLACDPENRVPLTWEVLEPSPPSNRGQTQRIRRAEKSLSSLQWLAPTFRHVHATGASLPQECVGLMSPTFLSDQFDTMYNVPSYRAWFLAQDMLPAYRFHRRFLQHLQQRQCGQRWILKAPVHMFALRTLLAVYPGASFVQTHRDPIEAIASVSSLIAILRRVFSDVVDPRQVGRDAIGYWSATLNQFLSERDQLLPGRVCDVPFTEIRRDPMISVRRIYEYFGWSLSRATERRMHDALAAQPHEQRGCHRYDPAQFGIDIAKEADSFGDYCQRFDLTSSAESEATERAA